MEDLFRHLSNYVALALETAGILIILYGGGAALVPLFRRQPEPLRTAWLAFAAWLLLGLEFTLGADVVRTAIAPSWNEIGQLAAIAFIRTFLNYFLERDLQARAEASAWRPKARQVS